MRRILLPSALLAAVVAVALLAPLGAESHPERTTAFMHPATGHVPKYRHTGPSNVVCTKTSRSKLRHEFRGHKLRSRLHVLARCRYHTIQAAIDHAKSGYRVRSCRAPTSSGPAARSRSAGPARSPARTTT